MNRKKSKERISCGASGSIRILRCSEKTRWRPLSGILSRQRDASGEKESVLRTSGKEAVVDEILEEFGLHPEGAHIVNGHVPVKCKNGESPIKCNGKVLVIDGGFSRAYQKETGIAGYTLVYNSYGLVLVAHEPFESKEAAVEKGSDIHSDYMVVKRVTERRLVGNTDIGTELKEQVADLESLLAAYRSGQVIEKL